MPGVPTGYKHSAVKLDHTLVGSAYARLTGVVPSGKMDVTKRVEAYRSSVAMATHEAEAASTVSRLFGSLGRIGLVLTFTAVETIALVAWLGLVDGAPVASQAAALGLGVLIFGLLLEHYLTDLAVNGRSGTFPAWRALGFSVSEALLWAIWLLIAERLGGVAGVAVAGVVLAVLLVPQHTIEDNVLRGRGLFERAAEIRSSSSTTVSVWSSRLLRATFIAWPTRSPSSRSSPRSYSSNAAGRAVYTPMTP